MHTHTHVTARNIIWLLNAHTDTCHCKEQKLTKEAIEGMQNRLINWMLRI